MEILMPSLSLKWNNMLLDAQIISELLEYFLTSYCLSTEYLQYL